MATSSLAFIEETSRNPLGSDVSGYLATHSNGRRRVFSVELSSRSSSRANNSHYIVIRVLKLGFLVREKIRQLIRYNIRVFFSLVIAVRAR